MPEQSIEQLQREAGLPLPPIAGAITKTFHQECDALAVVDQRTYELAGTHRSKAKGWLAEIGKIFDPEIGARHKLWKAALALKAYFADPLEVDVAILDRKILAFDREQKQKAEAERIRRESDARKKQEEDAAIAAAQAAEAGASKAEVKEITRQVLTAPIPVPQVQSYTPMSTARTREKWVARVTDTLKFVRWVAAHPEELNLIIPNQAALNAKARSQRQYGKIDGVVFEDEGNVAGRSA